MSALSILSLAPSLSREREVHIVCELVFLVVSREGEPLEVYDEKGGQPPDGNLLGGLPMLLALRAVPEEEEKVEVRRE